MKWTKEEKLKMVLEYRENCFTPIVEGCSRKTMCNRIRKWAKVYDLYGESGLEHRSRHWTFEDKTNAVQRVLNGESYAEVAHSLGMPIETQVLTWHRKYLEFGSPVLPQIKEAILLHMIDDIDAKMMVVDKALMDIEPGQYSAKVAPLDNRILYKPKK